MILMSQSEVVSSRKNLKFHLSSRFYPGWASRGRSRTLENTARGRKKVHEVQTHQLKSNSKPPGDAQKDPQEKFP